MEKRCALCNKTATELAEEEIKNRVFAVNSIHISINDELAYPYSLCGGCEDVVMTLIPAILEKLEIIKFDEKKDKYVLMK